MLTMNTFRNLCLLSCLLVRLCVDCQVFTSTQALPAPTQRPNSAGDDSLGEPLKEYITPTSIIMVVDKISYAVGASILPIGVIFVYTREDIPKLYNAHLLTKIDWRDNGFVRCILEDETSLDRWLGFLVVKRPVPDPDISFESLANDSLLNGVPNDLRANVDPESLIPPPTKGCLSNEYVLIIPVSGAMSDEEYHLKLHSLQMSFISVQSQQIRRVCRA